MNKTQIDFRRISRDNADYREKLAVHSGSVVGVDQQGNMQSIRRSGGYFTNFLALPGTALAAGKDPGLIISGSSTGTVVVARATKGGFNLKTQATAPANNDNAILVSDTNSAYRVTNTSKTGIIFESRVNLTSIASVMACFGVSENLTTVDPTATAGDGALFTFDPTNVFANNVNAAAVLTNWLLSSKVAGVDTLIDTGIPVVANQDYTLRIEMDENLIASFYIDGKLVGTGPALTANAVISPLLGVQTKTAAQKDVDIRYVDFSRAIG